MPGEARGGLPLQLEAGLFLESKLPIPSSNRPLPSGAPKATSTPISHAEQWFSKSTYLLITLPAEPPALVAIKLESQEASLMSSPVGTEHSTTSGASSNDSIPCCIRVKEAFLSTSLTMSCCNFGCAAGY